MTSHDRGREAQGRTPCERCQGNGEIVTDWDRYLSGEDAVADCRDCSGYGFSPLPKEEPKVIATCDHCSGHGDVGPARSSEGDWLDQPCPKCAGTGSIRS